mgnify:CR=1 FL=1
MDNKKNITIGIDLDDTISSSNEMFIKYAKLYNKEKKINFKIDETQWDLDKSFGWNDNNYKEFCKQYLRTLLNEAEIKYNAAEKINKLKNEGYKIIIITSRNEKELNDMYSFTEKWLKNHNINYDKLIINSLQKEEECLKNKVNIFIDDNMKNCMNVYKKLQIPVFLFDGLYNTNDKYSNIERVYSWDEIYLKIKNIVEEN